MIEQLQALMKALEAGAYSAQPPEPETIVRREPPISMPRFIVMDEYNNTMFEGTVDQWSLTKDNSMFGQRIDITGIAYPTARVASKYEEPETAIAAPKACNHSWKQYKGFMDSYEYCEHCNEKKT